MRLEGSSAPLAKKTASQNRPDVEDVASAFVHWLQTATDEAPLASATLAPEIDAGETAGDEDAGVAQAGVTPAASTPLAGILELAGETLATERGHGKASLPAAVRPPSVVRDAAPASVQGVGTLVAQPAVGLTLTELAPMEVAPTSAPPALPGPPTAPTDTNAAVAATSRALVGAKRAPQAEPAVAPNAPSPSGTVASDSLSHGSEPGTRDATAQASVAADELERHSNRSRGRDETAGAQSAPKASGTGAEGSDLAQPEGARRRGPLADSARLDQAGANDPDSPGTSDDVSAAGPEATRDDASDEARNTSDAGEGFSAKVTDAESNQAPATARKARASQPDAELLLKRIAAAYPGADARVVDGPEGTLVALKHPVLGPIELRMEFDGSLAYVAARASDARAASALRRGEDGLRRRLRSEGMQLSRFRVADRPAARRRTRSALDLEA
ncbi:MAG: flagellar hook-length control protein FliK [Myxococcota bacterium]